MSSRTVIAFRSASSQGTGQLIRLPDIPGQVVEVRSVHVQIQGVTEDTSISHGLYHNTDQSVVHGINIVAEQWLHFDHPAVFAAGDEGSPASPLSFYFAVPYDLVGNQKWEMAMSDGTVVAVMTIIYTMRKEANRTLWNELRARTSFERAEPV